MEDGSDLGAALAVLVDFLGSRPLTDSIKDLEHALAGAPATNVSDIASTHRISPAVLESALTARANLGRLNDVIHAAGISLALPHLLNANEVLKRPSLAAGNDKSRLFDVETQERAMEFKFARWSGSDAGRKRAVAKDFVHLAELTDGRRAELYVLGQLPGNFLRNSTAKMSWALDKATNTRVRFVEKFGTLDQSVAEFYESARDRVDLIDLELLLPDLFSPTG